MGENDWKETLPEDIRGNPAIEKYTSVEDLAKGLINAQEVIGRKGIIPPGDDAGDEDRKAFLEGLRPHEEIIRKEFFKVPEAPDKYELPKVDLPEGIALSEEYAGKFKEAAHKLGLSKDQAAALWKDQAESSLARYNQVMESFNAKRTEAEAALKKEWGDKYDEKVEKAKLVVKSLGGEDFVNYLEETRLGDHPAMIKFIAAIGEHISEDKLVTTPPGTYGKTRTEEELRAMMRDPKYFDPAHRDPAFVKEVEEGFRKLYPGTAATAPVDRRRA